jgi:hypothetical protein
MNNDEFHDFIRQSANPYRIPYSAAGCLIASQQALDKKVKVFCTPPKPAPQPQPLQPAWTAGPVVPTPRYQAPRQTVPRRPRQPIQVPDWLVATAKALGVSAFCALVSAATALALFGLIEWLAGPESTLPLFILVRKFGGGWLWLTLWAIWSTLHYLAGIGIAALAAYCAACIRRATKRALYRLGMALVRACGDSR